MGHGRFVGGHLGAVTERPLVADDVTLGVGGVQGERLADHGVGRGHLEGSRRGCGTRLLLDAHLAGHRVDAVVLADEFESDGSRPWLLVGVDCRRAVCRPVRAAVAGEVPAVLDDVTGRPRRVEGGLRPDLWALRLHLEGCTRRRGVRPRDRQALARLVGVIALPNHLDGHLVLAGLVVDTHYLRHLCGVLDGAVTVDIPAVLGDGTGRPARVEVDDVAGLCAGRPQFEDRLDTGRLWADRHLPAGLVRAAVLALEFECDLVLAGLPVRVGDQHPIGARGRSVTERPVVRRDGTGRPARVEADRLTHARVGGVHLERRRQRPLVGLDDQRSRFGRRLVGILVGVLHAGTGGGVLACERELALCHTPAAEDYGADCYLLGTVVGFGAECRLEAHGRTVVDNLGLPELTLELLEPCDRPDGRVVDLYGELVPEDPLCGTLYHDIDGHRITHGGRRLPGVDGDGDLRVGLCSGGRSTEHADRCRPERTERLASARRLLHHCPEYNPECV